MENKALATQQAPISAAVQELVLLNGDLSKLTAAGRVEYMLRVCETLGLNPLTKPFEFISLNGKLVMYSKKDCTEQLRKINSISIRITSREVVEDIYVVTAQATDGKGRTDESIGAVPIAGIKGEARANAFMKAETKAKRRVTLSVSGLGMLDESEVDSIPGAAPVVTEARIVRGDPGAAARVAAYEAERAGPKAVAPQSLVSIVENATGLPLRASATPSTTPATPAENSREPGSDDGEEPEAIGAWDHDPKPGEIREQVECWTWKSTGSKKAGTLQGDWVSIGLQNQRSLAQNAKIHALKTELGITDEQWRSRLATLFSKESSGDLSVREANDLIDKLERRKRDHGTKADKDARQAKRAEGVAEEFRLNGFGGEDVA